MTIQETKPEVIEFTNIEDAIAHVEKLEKEAGEAVQKYRAAVCQFTGIGPGQQIGPMDMVKLILKFKGA